MTLHPLPLPSIPKMTAQVAQSAFPKGNLYMRLRDTLGVFFTDDDFAYSRHFGGLANFGDPQLARINRLANKSSPVRLNICRHSILSRLPQLDNPKQHRLLIGSESPFQPVINLTQLVKGHKAILGREQDSDQNGPFDLKRLLCSTLNVRLV